MAEATTRSALLFGSYDAALHPRVAVLRDGLAAHGWDVSELNAPLGASTADKVAAAGSAGAAVTLARKQGASWRRLVAERRGLDADPDVVLVGYLGHADVHLARALFPRATIVLDHLVGLADTVRDRGLSQGVAGRGKLRALDAADRAALRAANVVVVDTAEQVAVLPEGARAKAVIVPVGASADWFAAAGGAAEASAADPAGAAGANPAGALPAGAVPAGRAPESASPSRTPSASDENLPVDAEVLESGGGPAGAGAEDADAEPAEDDLRVVFFGLFTPLQGAATIARTVDQLRDAPVTVTMVGHGQDHAEVRRILADHPGVTWLDWVESAELPALVAGHDVCLGIFGTGPKTQRVVPTKVYQGLAAGCAVVTAETPAAAALGDGVLRVPPGDPDALAAVLRHLATDRKALSMARRRARAAAQSFTPEAVTAGLDAHLASTPPRAALPPLTFNAWLRWDVISAELARLEVSSVLEIGPGEGAAACRLAPGRAYTGVELSSRTRAISEQRLAAQGSPGRLLGSLDELGPDERFDLVCAFEVIEHIEDDRGALAEWASRVRPGGALIASTPSGPERMGAADTIAGHFRRYDDAALAEMAREIGLEDVRVVHVGYPFGYALEAVRNRVAARRLAAQAAGPVGGQSGGPHGSAASGSTADDVARSTTVPATSHDEGLADFTEGSSSFLQPPAWAGPATRIVSAPGRWMQRRFPDRGPGLVLIGRAPAAGEEPPTAAADAG